MKNLKSHLKESYRLAIENAKKVADKNKRRFDVQVRESTLEIGDRVLVRNLRLRNKHKLADRLESAVYIVQRRAGDLPVYTVCPDGQVGSPHTLHRDLLLPCGFLSGSEEEIERPKSVCRPRTGQTPIQLNEQPLYPEDDDDNNPWFHPMEISEMETRSSEVSDITKIQREIAYGSEIPTRAEYLPVPSSKVWAKERKDFQVVGK